MKLVYIDLVRSVVLCSSELYSAGRSTVYGYLTETLPYGHVTHRFMTEYIHSIHTLYSQMGSVNIDIDI